MFVSVPIIITHDHCHEKRCRNIAHATVSMFPVATKRCERVSVRNLQHASRLRHLMQLERLYSVGTIVRLRVLIMGVRAFHPARVYWHRLRWYRLDASSGREAATCTERRAQRY